MNMASPSALPSYRQPSKRGFSLVEMLVVISIASILSILVSAGFKSIMGGSFNTGTAEIANTLIRARAHAMANNTYVFVGIQEVDASKASSGLQTAGTGRIGITVVASKDGTRGYLPSSPSNLLANSLTVVLPLRHYDNIHIAPSSGTNASKLPNTSVGTSYLLANSSGASLTTFNWPLSGTAQYSFGNNPGTVIQFSPRGEAQIVTSQNTDAIFQWIEIDLVPTNGRTVPATTVNPATILIDGASGSVSTFRA